MALKIEKTETTYQMQLHASEYDFLEVVEDIDKRITIKFLDSRWRTKEKTISMLQEIIEALKSLK